jgi:hypothetical protein
MVSWSVRVSIRQVDASLVRWWYHPFGAVGRFIPDRCGGSESWRLVISRQIDAHPAVNRALYQL